MRLLVLTAPLASGLICNFVVLYIKFKKNYLTVIKAHAGRNDRSYS